MKEFKVGQRVFVIIHLTQATGSYKIEEAAVVNYKPVLGIIDMTVQVLTVNHKWWVNEDKVYFTYEEAYDAVQKLVQKRIEGYYNNLMELKPK